MLQYSVLKKQSRNNLGIKLSLDKRINSKKMSTQASLPRRKSYGKSINKLDMSLMHNKSITNDTSLHYIKKGKNQASELFLKAKSYYKDMKLQQACKEFDKVLNIEPQHLESLYLQGISCLNLNKTNEAIKSLEKLLNLQPDYKSNVYLLLSICHNKLKNSDKALGYLTTAIQKYQDFYEAYCYRGKVYMAQKKYNKAEQDFDKAIEINKQKQIAYCGKGDCLRNRGLYKQAIKYYSLSLEISANTNIILKRAIVYYQNQMYVQSIDDINHLLYLEQSSEAYYYRGMLYLKYQKDQSKAILNFEQSIKQNTNQKILTKSAEELLKIKIVSCDFYECTSIIKWAEYNKIKNLQNWVKLIESVISLMKKKYEEAEENFKILEKNLKQADENYQYIFPLYNLYRGYGLFLLFKYESAYNHIVQYQKYMETILGQQIKDLRMKYNKILFESLMLCQCECYQQSLEKIDQLIDMQPTKIQYFFYKAMILMIISISEAPYVFELQNKQQILLSTLETIQNGINVVAHPNLLFYDALLKGYFGLLPEAEKSISKAIQKGQQHLGKFFHLRAIINSMSNSNEQAINDVSVSINIEQKPEYYLTRCKLYQIMKQTESAYEDLQKYIELEDSQVQVSKWAAIILFYNKAYQESERALQKVTYVHEHPELVQLQIYINFMNGRFEQAGLEGALVLDILQGNEKIGLDQLINQKQSYGFFNNQYLYWIRALKHYSNKKYTLAIKDFQYLMFVSKEENQLFLEVKYNLLICHLLNGDQDKSQALAKGKYNEINERIVQILSANENEELKFDDLSEFFPSKHLSQFIPHHTIPNTKTEVKLSVPFPEFANINIQPKITDEFLERFIKLELVEGKGEAPWIRKMEKNQAIQFTNMIESQDVSFQTSINTTVAMN